MKEDLKDIEYREAFVSEHIDTGIPFQLKALRNQRDWTQKDFEKHSGVKQAEMSRYENVNYAKFTLSTLKKLASAFDIGIMVRFVSFSELVEHELNLSPESLEAASYEDDPYFKDDPEEEFNIKDTMGVSGQSVLGSNKVVSFEERRAILKKKKAFQYGQHQKETNQTSNLIGAQL